MYVIIRAKKIKKAIKMKLLKNLMNQVQLKKFRVLLKKSCFIMINLMTTI